MTKLHYSETGLPTTTVVGTFVQALSGLFEGTSSSSEDATLTLIVEHVEDDNWKFQIEAHRPCSGQGHEDCYVRGSMETSAKGAREDVIHDARLMAKMICDAFDQDISVVGPEIKEGLKN
jgi:hypothetical protein